MIINKSLKIKFWLLSILHFLVDGICAYTVVNKLYKIDNIVIIALVFIGYNSFAFLLQPVFGLLVDKLKKEKMFLSISLIMLLMGALINLPWFIVLALIGPANAIFHIVGGKYTIYESSDKLSHLGIFVSLGATGLAIGSYINSKIVLQVFVVLTLIIGTICYLLKDEKALKKEDIKFTSNHEIKLVTIIAIIVLIRGIMGKASLPLFEVTNLSLVLIAISSTLGKALGGIIADRIGIKITVFLTLPLSLIGYFFFRNNLCIYLISTLLFNTTMPITLFLANKNLKTKEGLSFGILAFMLFPGYLIGELYIYLNLAYPPLLVVSVVLSIMVIIYANKKTLLKEDL